MGRWRLVLAVASASAVTACSAGGGEPVRAAAPSVAPSASVRTSGTSRACVVPRDSGDDRTRGLVRVDTRATGVVAVWQPGMGQQPCRAALTRGSAALARRLAEDVAAAPAWPSGAFNCPNDDGAAARLYFGQPGTARPELVDLRLGGCTGLSAPGRRSRRLTERFAHDLSPIAPGPWRARL